jgi:cytochrome c oxidase subunit 1
MTAPTISLTALETRVERHRRLAKWQLYLGFLGLAIGLLMGFLQAMDRLGVDLYDAFQLESYYQGLTLHGVALAFVFTFTFANGFLSLTVMKSLDRPLTNDFLALASFWTAAAGTAMASVAILMNKATVLYTFYSPMQAAAAFYLGAVLLVISTWLVSANQLLTLREWRKENPGEPIPLLAFVSIVTFIMWDLASLGVAVETLAFLLPWSLGWVQNTDPLLNRTLFWFTGHPIVYFWLLPAYVSWYMMVPKQVGGKLFSAGVVKLVFILFLLLSVPVGLHHQFTDPGIDEGLKFVHAFLTFGVFFPSMVTAFTLLAALENGAKRNGGKGIVRWIAKLPWGNPSVTGQLLAMLAFTLGGATGLINASATVNAVVHNTSFIPGHFHLTVGTASALSFMAISYWLVPYLTHQRLFKPRMALTQVWLWFIGVLLFARGQMWSGIEGQPRRLWVQGAPYIEEGWESGNVLTGLGGTLMFISGILFFAVMIGTLLSKKQESGEEFEMPVSETVHTEKDSPGILDRLGLWMIAAVILVLIAYIPVLLFTEWTFPSPPWQLF